MTDEVAEYNIMDRVVDLKLKGRSEYQIARELNIKRVEVINIMNEWYRTVRSAETKDRAQARLAEFEESTQMQVQELWENIEDLKANNEYKAVAPAVKAINDIEHRRFDALQKAGLIDDAELGDMLAQQQEQAVQLEELLRELADKFPETKSWLLPKLRRIFRPDELPEPDIIDGDVVD